MQLLIYNSLFSKIYVIEKYATRSIKKDSYSL